VLTTSLVHKFNISFRVIPVREWSKEVLSNKLDILNLPRVQGEIEVDLTVSKHLTGTFKTAHHGRLSSPVTGIPACFDQKICVKQTYKLNANGTKSRFRGDADYEKIVQEIICLDWATILLDLTYIFIEGAVVEHGEPPGGIPRLCFVRAMLAEGTPTVDPQEKKYFLIEEWMGDAAETFTKYINNGHPESCVQADAPAEAHQIAEFLCFVQHVQYNQTGGLAFTSDYQGL